MKCLIQRAISEAWYFVSMFLFLSHSLFGQADFLPEKMLEYLKTQPQPTANFNDVILPSGKTQAAILDKGRVIASDDTFERALEKLMGDLGKEAAFLTDDANHRYATPLVGADPAKWPEQNGLAYNYGSKNYTVRTV